MKQSKLLDLTIEELKALSPEELVKVERNITKIINQKLYRLEQAGVAKASAAYNLVDTYNKSAQNKPRFNAPHIDVTQGKRERNKVISYINNIQEKIRTDKTLSVKETKKLYDKTMRQYFGELSPSSLNKAGSFYSLYNKMKELKPELWANKYYDSKRIVDAAFNYYESNTDLDARDMLRYVEQELGILEAEEAQAYNDFIEIEGLEGELPF